MSNNKMKNTIDSHVSTMIANPFVDAVLRNDSLIKRMAANPLAKLAKPLNVNKTINTYNEVNQSPLRAATPGVYSVNSVKLCPRLCTRTSGFSCTVWLLALPAIISAGRQSPADGAGRPRFGLLLFVIASCPDLW